jgi:hypothetical protein
MGAKIIIDFIKEFLSRMTAKSPWFFKILQLFFASLTFAGYVPSMLQRWLNIEVPGHVITLCEDIAKYATGFFVAALLPVKSEPVAVTQQGEVLRKVDEDKLPFTAAKEQAAAQKSDDLPTVSNQDLKQNP